MTRKILNGRKQLDRPFGHSSRHVIKVMNKVCELKEIPPATVQDLRSSTYSYMVKIGVPQPLIRKIIGHTGDRVGQIHYFNMSAEEVIEQTQGLEELVGES